MRVLSTIGASAMKAYSSQVDTVSNNIANVNTRDYVRKESVFNGLISSAISQGVTPVIEDGNIGHGLAITERFDFQRPGLLFTGNPLDLALSEQGFFRLELNGQVFFSNRGEFNIDGEGRLVHSSGALIPNIVVTPGSELAVESSGRIWLIDGEDEIEAGFLEVVNFVNPQGLEHIGGGCFVPTPASGNPEPDLENQVRQGYRRLPAVDFAEEMTRLITAQRAYQLNSRTVRIADELWERTNDLKR